VVELEGVTVLKGGWMFAQEGARYPHVAVRDAAVVAIAAGGQDDLNRDTQV
jgi:hypothetical protein